MESEVSTKTEANSTQNEAKQPAPTAVKNLPSTKELLKAGVQFGHESKRWNPKMRKYIFGAKNNIHIIDINQTEKKLEEAAKFLKEAASRGNVLFIGTKRQASDIIKTEAIRAGAYFIDSRWAGGLLTNFSVVRRSLSKLNSLEKSFEEGIEDRTKYEVSRMKKEWQRLERLYSGIKGLSEKPAAAVIIDTNFEKSAVKECKKIKLPIVAIVDTNSDPDSANYVVPGNDDAIGSITILMKTLADAVLEGNKGNGVKHNLKNYAEMEIKITKPKTEEEGEVKSAVETAEIKLESDKEMPKLEEESTAKRSRTKVKGILEKVKEDAQIKKETKKKSAVTEKPAAKKTATKKTVEKKTTKK